MGNWGGGGKSDILWDRKYLTSLSPSFLICKMGSVAHMWQVCKGSTLVSGTTHERKSMCQPRVLHAQTSPLQNASSLNRLRTKTHMFPQGLQVWSPHRDAGSSSSSSTSEKWTARKWNKQLRLLIGVYFLKMNCDSQYSSVTCKPGPWWAILLCVNVKNFIGQRSVLVARLSVSKEFGGWGERGSS